MPLVLVGTLVIDDRQRPIDSHICLGAAGFGKTSLLASVVAHLLQETHSIAYTKIKLPAYPVFRSIGLTEMGSDPVRLLDSILLEIHAVVERKPTPESLERAPHHDCVLQMSSDALDAAMLRLPALAGSNLHPRCFPCRVSNQSFSSLIMLTLSCRLKCGLAFSLHLCPRMSKLSCL
jgi:hypothetical protein